MRIEEYTSIDDQKLKYHPEWVKRWHAAQNDWRLVKTIYPIYVEISPAGQCNHRCPWCAVDYIGYKNRLLTVDGLAQTFEQMTLRRHNGEPWNGVRSIMFAGEGEPTLHPRLSEMISWAKKFEIDTALTTNGTMMGKRFIDAALSNLTWIKVSLDAATPETHALNHHASKEDFSRAVANQTFRILRGRKLASSFGNEFDKIIENIRYACEANKDRGCMIGVQLILNPTNIDEAEDFVKLMKSLGCDYCVIKPYSQHLYSVNQQTQVLGEMRYVTFLGLEQRLKSYEDKGFKVIFRSQTMENYENPDRQYEKCMTTPVAWGYIMATGEYVSCSAYLPQDVGQGDQRFVLGNIQNQTFQEIWEGEKRRQNWKFVTEELDISECRKNCRMNSCNIFLWNKVRPSSRENLVSILPTAVPALRNVNFI